MNDCHKSFKWSNLNVLGPKYSLPNLFLDDDLKIMDECYLIPFSKSQNYLYN